MSSFVFAGDVLVFVGCVNDTQILLDQLHVVDGSSSQYSVCVVVRDLNPNQYI